MAVPVAVGIAEGVGVTDEAAVPVRGEGVLALEDVGDCVVVGETVEVDVPEDSGVPAAVEAGRVPPRHVVLRLTGRLGSPAMLKLVHPSGIIVSCDGSALPVQPLVAYTLFVNVEASHVDTDEALPKFPHDDINSGDQ